MFIFIHILIALSGLAQASYGLIKPSRNKFYGTYVLTALTFVSGTYLVIATHSAILTSCMSGLTYLAVIISATVAAHYRLGKQITK